MILIGVAAIWLTAGLAFYGLRRRAARGGPSLSLLGGGSEKP